MQKLILASHSPQRKKLLKQYGIPFTVEPSNAKESFKIRTRPSTLVIENALLKAQAIAKKRKKGIVLGSDTLVYAGGKKIIGKPKSKKQAVRILKGMFKKPHWVYTGVALVDAQTGQTATGFEKTKITMNALSDDEIKRYHKKVSPLDKAGGFDIEGWGGLFIKKIEGCYTNVIGLPMAKLREMLKKMGVSVLSVCFVFMLAGCSTEYNLATRQQETLMHSTEKEVKIGEAIAQKIEKKYELVEDVDINEKVQKILNDIVAVCDRKDILYFIKVIDDDEIVNAVSLPGGYIYLFSGLIDKVENDDQLAGVIAHEVAHIAARHSVKRLQASYGAMLLQLAAYETAGGHMASGVNIALSTIFTEYSQKDEFESDILAVKYLRKAGYNPEEMAGFLRVLDEHHKEEIRSYSYWRTHPGLSKRIAVVNKEVTGKMEFKDYLNLTGEE